MFRIQYQIENTPTSTPNGGIMVRAPYFAYTGATTNDVLAQKPTGFNYDVCGAALAFCNRTTPGASTTYNWAGAPGPFPPASNASTRRSSTRAATARARPPRASTTSTAPTASR